MPLYFMPKQLGVAIESQYKPSFNSLKIINSYRRSNKISLNQIYFIQKIKNINCKDTGVSYIAQ